MFYTEAGIPISLPADQQWLLDFFTILGYEPGEADKKIGDCSGFCCGIGHLAVPAILGGDIEPFKQRFYRIYTLLKKLKKESRFSIEEELELFRLFPECQYGLEDERNYIKTLSILNDALPPTNNEALRDIQAFCDNVVLYQFIPLFENIFGTPRSWSELIPFLFSPKINALGGIGKPIENFQQSFVNTELSHYFKTLKTLLENASPSPITQPLSLVLTSLKPDGSGFHTINVSFHQGKWRLIDANNLELMDTEFSSDEEISARVMHALGTNVQESWDENSELSMLTETYVTGNFLDTFTPHLASWQSDIMKITRSASDNAAPDIDALLASLLYSEPCSPVQNMHSDPWVQADILELAPDLGYSPVATTEVSHAGGEIRINSINVSLAANELFTQSYGFAQDKQEESQELFSPIDETPVETVANAAREVLRIRQKRKGDTEEGEKDRAKEEQEFSSRKRRLMGEDAGNYLFFASSRQEDDLSSLEYERQQNLSN